MKGKNESHKSTQNNRVESLLNDEIEKRRVTTTALLPLVPMLSKHSGSSLIKNKEHCPKLNDDDQNGATIQSKLKRRAPPPPPPSRGLDTTTTTCMSHGGDSRLLLSSSSSNRPDSLTRTNDDDDDDEECYVKENNLELDKDKRWVQLNIERAYDRNMATSDPEYLEALEAARSVSKSKTNLFVPKMKK